MMILKYTSTISTGEEWGKESRSDSVGVHREMNGEQIRDFVRKLGFLDKDKDDEKIKHFLHLNQVSHNMASAHSCMTEK
jgi:hypothetical protein